jgi:hypothetical protein
MTVQAVFTPTVPSAPGAISMMTFPLETKLETRKEYRITENQGLVGNYAIFLEEKSVPETVVVVGLVAIYTTLKAAENFQGTLNIRGTSISYVRLMNVKFLGLLEVSATAGTPISTSGTYARIETTWIKEAS